MEIVPAILESDVEAVRAKLSLAVGKYPVIQIDLLDGQLFPRLTVTPSDLGELDFTPFQLDFHLMTQDPLDYLYELASQKPALPVRHVSAQIERLSDQLAFLAEAKSFGYSAGLALDLETPLDSLDDASWRELDNLLFLAVPLGSQGQTFQPRIYQKIRAAQKILTARHLTPKLIVDGGLTPAHFSQLQNHRVTTAVLGSYIWHHPNYHPPNN